MSRRIIVDLEMTGLSMKSKMISLAALDMETGKAFYAESIEWRNRDIDKSNMDWMNSNVLSQLLFTKGMKDKLCRGIVDEVDVINLFPELPSINIKDTNKCIHIHDNQLTDVVLGNTVTIRNKFTEWMSSIVTEVAIDNIMYNVYDKVNEDIIFLMDVGHYDFVFLCELYGGAFNLPSFVLPLYHDINYDIAMMNQCKLKDAFDLNRVHIALEKDRPLYGRMCKKYPLFSRAKQHNAFFDVYVSNTILN